MMSSDKEIKILSASMLLPIEDSPLESGAVAFSEGKIEAIGLRSELRENFPTAKETFFEHCLLMPGLVNPHCSLETLLVPDSIKTFFSEPKSSFPFIRWLLELAKFKSKLSREEYSANITQGLHLLKRNGVTTVGNFSAHEDTLPLYDKEKLRTIAFAEIFNLFKNTITDDFTSALTAVDKTLEWSSSFISAGLAPYSSFTVSKNLLKILDQHALQSNIPVHIHCAQTFCEMEFFYDSKGDIPNLLFPELGWKEIPPPHQMTPIQYLREIGLVKENLALVGCLHLGATDLSILENSKTKIILAPAASAAFQSGEIPLKKIIDSNVPWALTALGPAWGSSFSLWDEMRTLAKMASKQGFHLPGETLLEHATLTAAKTLGLDKQIGSLKKGKCADFTLVELPKKQTGKPWDDLIAQTHEKQIKGIWVEGKSISFES